MKTTLTTSQAAHELRSDENAAWSYAGATALVEYLEQLEEDTGEEIEFDRVAIRCDFAEWASLREWAEDYFGDWRADLSIEADADDDEIDDVIRRHIEDHGTLLEFDGGVIVSAF